MFFFIGASSCLEEKTDFSGNDIKKVTAYSWEDCGNYFFNNWMPFTKLWMRTNTFLVILTLIYEFTFLDVQCSNNEQCKFWTWSRGTECFLKTSDAGRNGKCTGECFSGPKGCSYTVGMYLVLNLFFFHFFIAFVLLLIMPLLLTLCIGKS